MRPERARVQIEYRASRDSVFPAVAGASSDTRQTVPHGEKQRTGGALGPVAAAERRSRAMHRRR